MVGLPGETLRLLDASARVWGLTTMDPMPFKYQPKCSVPGCGRPGVFKVAAPWSYGSINELKNYGVSCEEHRDALFTRATAENAGLAAVDGEKFGPVGVYQILLGVRDADLTRVM